jgi:hypothetical protein
MSKNTKIEPINRSKALVEAKINSIKKNGRKEITTINELKKFSIGSLISYMNKSGTYKSGGFLWKIADDNFIYLNLETNQKFRVQMENVDKMWVGSVYDVKNDIVSLVKTTKKKTINPVEVGGVVVNYTKNKYDYERYICTQKYKMMKKWYEIFGQSNN